jgi:hypothetical protein
MTKFASIKADAQCAMFIFQLSSTSSRLTLAPNHPARATMGILSLAGQYLKDLRKFPEIAPVTFIVIGASTVATTFMAHKLTHTPDVTVNPTKPYNYQNYAHLNHHADHNCSLCKYKTTDKHVWTY